MQFAELDGEPGYIVDTLSNSTGVIRSNVPLLAASSGVLCVLKLIDRFIRRLPD